MIISRTPYRLSLFGGGTDFPSWYSKHGGSVLTSTIDKYCYLTCRYLPPFLEHRYRIVWSKLELCKEISEITHPVVRAVLEHTGITRGLEVSAVGDLPARSGMGTSSAYTVGLLNACYALMGKMINKHDLAMEAIHIEQNVLKEKVGSQDQVAAAFGGFNRIDFHASGEISVTPITVPSQRIRELSSHLMLFYTGIKRTSSDVQAKFVKEISAKKDQLRIMSNLVDESIDLLNSSKDIKGFGDIFREAWDIKRNFSDLVTNQDVENMHAAAIEAGALGGKITGAGGGGFLLLFVPPEFHNQVKAALNQFLYVPFQFDYTGSQIIYAREEQDYSSSEVARIFQPIKDFRELRLGEKTNGR